MQPTDKWRKTLMEVLRRLQRKTTTTNTRTRYATAGYSPKQILEQLLLIAKADSTPADASSVRNLSLQLRAALRRAVAEGLLKLRAGRYTLTAAVVVDKQRVDKKEPVQLRRQSQRENSTTVVDSMPSKIIENQSVSKKKKGSRRKRAKSKKSSRSKR